MCDSALDSYTFCCLITCVIIDKIGLIPVEILIQSRQLWSVCPSSETLSRSTASFVRASAALPCHSFHFGAL